jgi:hypothetical protein
MLYFCYHYVIILSPFLDDLFSYEFKLFCVCSNFSPPHIYNFQTREQFSQTLGSAALSYCIAQQLH